MHLTKFVFTILIYFFTFPCFSYDLFELKLAMKADGISMSQDIQYPENVAKNTFPTGVIVTFDDKLSAENKVVWKIQNNSSTDLQNIEVLTYADIEIEEVSNTFFNETVTLDELILPESIASYSNLEAQEATEWMVGEPGYSTLGIVSAYNTFTLTNTTELNSGDDPAILFKHDISGLAKGESFYIELHIGDSTIHGIKQIDMTSNTNQYINSIVFAAEYDAAPNPNPGQNSGLEAIPSNSLLSLALLSLGIILLISLKINRKKAFVMLSVLTMFFSSKAATLNGGDAASIDDADLILEMVFAIDTSGSMFDEADSITTIMQDVTKNLSCPDSDVWVRSRYVGYNGGIGSGLFDEGLDTVLDIRQEYQSFHLAVDNIASHYPYVDDSRNDQGYVKAVVTIGDGGSRSIARKYDYAYAANQAAIANDVVVFSVLANRPFTGTEDVMKAMSLGGVLPNVESDQPPYILNNTKGAFSDTTDNLLQQDIEKLICNVGKTYYVPRCEVNFSVRSKYKKSQLSWENNSAQSYSIYRSSAINGNFTKITESNSNTYLDNLPSTGNYYYQLKASDNSCESNIESTLAQEHTSNPLFNHAPKFTTKPSETVFGGTIFTYQPNITEIDGDSIEVTSITSPSSAIWDGTTLSWVSNFNERSEFMLQATDSKGAIAIQHFFVNVDNVSGGNNDNAPKITSTAPINARKNFEYTYTVEATDADNDIVYFYLKDYPSEMVIDSRTGIITWTPTATGLYDVEIVATDGAYETVQTITITVVENTDPTIISVPLLTTTAINKLWNYNVSAVDIDGDTLTYSLTDSPAGMTIDPTTGVVSWTPTTIDQHSITVLVEDGYDGKDTQTFDLAVTETVSNNNPIFTTSPPKIIIYDNETWIYEAVATDADGDNVTYTLLGSPAGMRIDKATGAISWSPTISAIGSYDFSIIANDNNGGYAVQLITLTVVSSSNNPPVFDSTPTGSFSEGDTFSYDANAVDPDGDTVTYSFEGDVPAGMTIDPQTGLVEWPNITGGNHIFTIVATDGVNQVEQTITLTVVSSSNNPPVFDSTPTGSFSEGDTFSYDANAVDPDGDTVTYSFEGEIPAGMTIDSQTGLVEWQNVTGGSHIFTIVATDGVNQVKQTITLTIIVDGKGSAPEITSTPSTAGQVGVGYSYQVIANDSDNNTLTYSLSKAPDGMKIDNTTGLVEWENPASGTYDIVISVYDGFYTTTQSYVLSINTESGNQPPVINSASPSSVMAGNIYSYQVNASDTESDPLTYRLESAPTGMSINTTGLLTWQTNDQNIGNYSVDVIVSDGYSETRQTINIEVKPLVPISENLTTALTWLKEQQQADGTLISGTIATQYQTTYEAFVAAKLLNDPFLDLDIRTYLNSLDIYLTESFARRVIYQLENNQVYTNSLSSILSRFETTNNAYADLDDNMANVVDTAYALLAQAKTTQNTSQVPVALGYLLSIQNNDGSFNMENNLSSYYVTSIALRALDAYKTSYNLSDAINRAKSYLVANYASTPSKWEKAHVLITLYSALDDKAVLESKVTQLLGYQYSNGSWDNDVFTTALAIQAIYLFSQ